MIKKIAIMLGMLFVAVAIGQNKNAAIEKLQYQNAPDLDGSSGVYSFTRYHDKESGTEFICAKGFNEGYSIYSVSCFPTGRNWK